MLRNKCARGLLMTTFAASVLAVLAFATPANGQCQQVTDQQIIDNIYAKFEANSKLKPQLSHLNVTVVREPVSGTMQSWKITGYVESQGDYDKVIDLMYDVFYELGGVKCLGNILFNQNSFYLQADYPENLKAGGGCGPNTVACGDICIPAGESCNIKGR